MLRAALLFVCLSLLDPPAVDVRDAMRFPDSAESAFSAYKFACAHVEHMQTHEPWEQAWLADAIWCKRAWDLLDDVKRLYPKNPAMLRRSLDLLRAHIGPCAYDIGLMPPPVPIWRFREGAR